MFGANTTTINFLLAHALGRTLEPGDEIVVTELDHDANVSPWLLVAGDRGLMVRTARMDPGDGTLDWTPPRELITTRTRVVAFTLASNALGIDPGCGRWHAAAHTPAPLGGSTASTSRRTAPYDRVALDADVLLTSAYKFFGPHLGVAAVRGDLARLAASRPRPPRRPIAGGSPFRDRHPVPRGDRRLHGRDRLPRVARRPRVRSGRRASTSRTRGSRLTSGTDATHAASGLARSRACACTAVTTRRASDERTPTFCFNLDGWTAAELSIELGRRGIFTYHGNYYALGAMTAFGLESSGGAVRAGYLHYTTPEEADRFCEVVSALARR